METKVLPSGATLEMTMSDFEISLNLLESVTRELEGVKLNTQSDVLDMVKSILMRGVYSQDIKRALTPCFERCSYNKKKINNDLFQDEKIRGDYLLVVKEVMVYNLTPFLSSLGLLFKDIQSQIPLGQKL